MTDDDLRPAGSVAPLSEDERCTCGVPGSRVCPLMGCLADEWPQLTVLAARRDRWSDLS